MSDKMKLLELDLGTDAVIAKSVELKDSLTKSREELDKLKKSGEGNSEAAIKLEASIKKLSSEYTNNQKVLSALVATNGKAIPISEKVNLLLNEENTTRLKAKQSIAEINKLKDELNVNIKEEAELLDQLNKKQDENTKFLRETGSEEDKRILNIGNYAKGITEAAQALGYQGTELRNVKAVLDVLEKPINSVAEGFSSAAKQIKNSAAETEGMSVAQKGLTIATNLGTGAMRIFALAVAATGIGLIIIAIALLIGYFKTFDPLIDKIEQGFAAFGAAVRVVQQTIVNFISNLKSVGDLFSKLGNFIAHPIDSLKEVGKEMENAARAAAELKEKQQDLADQQAIQSVANKKQEAEIARLILQSKDRGKTEEERIALLEKAEKLNQENFKKNADLSQQEYDNAVEASRIKGALTDQEVANLRRLGVEYAYKLLNQGKITQEEVDMITKAEEAKIDIYNRATAEQEKIQNRQNALIEKAEAAAEERRKKAEEARKKALDDAAKLAKAELDLYLSSQGIRAKSLQQELDIAEKVRDGKLKIAQAEFNASAKTKADELKLLTDRNNANDEFLKKQVEAVVLNAGRELDAIVEANKSKIDSQKFFSELSLQEEIRRLDLIAQKQTEFEKLRFDQGVINEQEYQDAIKKIQDETQAKKDEDVALRKEAETERQAIDLENQRAYEDLIFQENLEIQQQRLEQSRLQEVANSEKTGASIDLINKKYKAASEKLDREANTAKIANAQMAISDIGALMTGYFGENRLLSAALATVDTFLAIQKAYLSQLIPGDPSSVIRAQFAAAKAGAFGFLNVAKVSGVKLATGGKVTGPGSGTSDSIPAMLSNGESVINAKSTSMFGPLLSWINEIGGGKRFASGGVATTNSIVSSLANNSNPQLIDIDLLAVRLADANRSLPTPVLPLTDFHDANNKYVQIIDGATH
ncbi:hypothetical protein [Flavobacterium sp.]